MESSKQPNTRQRLAAASPAVQHSPTFTTLVIKHPSTVSEPLCKLQTCLSSISFSAFDYDTAWTHTLNDYFLVLYIPKSKMYEDRRRADWGRWQGDRYGTRNKQPATQRFRCMLSRCMMIVLWLAGRWGSGRGRRRRRRYEKRGGDAFCLWHRGQHKLLSQHFITGARWHGCG